MDNTPLFRVPFVLLFLIMLANASYASMGDISICFPFFLLLALLMAGMIAQGRSPLVGFDISLSKPPAEIKSTSYHFKSFSSGGYDSAAKFRDQLGGGNYLTRGFGWVANKMTKGAATAVSKASKGKYGSTIAKEGVKTLKTMADRGVLYALTKGKRGGGYEGILEREKTKMEKEVKTLKDTLIKLKGSKETPKTSREIANLQQRISDLEKRLSIQNQLVQQTEQARQRITKIAGVIGRIKMMGYPPTLVAGGSYLATKHAAKITKNSFEKWKVGRQIKKLREKKRDRFAAFTKKDELQLRKLRAEYARLSRRGPIARIFNPEGLSKREMLKGAAKLCLLSGATGFLSSFSQNIPYHVARNVLYERLRFRPDLSARAKRSEQTANIIRGKLDQLKNNPALTPSQKARLLKDVSVNLQNLVNTMGGNKFTRFLRDTESRAAGGTREREVRGLMKEIKNLRNEAIKLARAGKTEEFLNKVGEIENKFNRVDQILFAKDLREKMNKIDKKIEDLDKKFSKKKISKEKYDKKRKELIENKKELIRNAKTPGTIMGKVLKGEFAKESVEDTEVYLNRLRAKEERLKKDYKEGRIEKDEYEKKLKEIREERKEAPRYRRWKETYNWQTTGKLLTPEATRATWLGVERLSDFWHEKAEASKGSRSPAALATRGVVKSLDGILEMQRFRQVISEFENVIGPSIALLSQEEFKKAHLLRLLGQYQLELEDRKKKSKKIFGGKSLYERREELEEECRRLREELKNLKANTKEYREKQKALESAQRDLNNVNLLIRDAKKELAKTERNIRIILTHFTLKDALLAQRQLDAFRKGEDEVRRDIEAKINEVEKKLRSDYQQRRNIEKEMKELENQGKMDTRRYKGLEKKLANLESSIEKKERKRDELSLSLTKRYQDLERAVRETAEKTEIKVGGDKILRDRNIVLSEMSLLRAGMLEQPNSYILTLMKTYGVATTNEINTYRNLNNLQGNEKERVKSQYEKALRNTYSELKRKWDKLETINLADWTRKRMEETGDSLGGQETGLYRDLLELQGVITKLEKDKELKGELGKYLTRKEKVISDMLYLTTLEYGQFLDAGVMKKYVDLYHEIEEMRRSNPKVAEFELKEIEMRLRAVQGEIKEAEELGWTQKVQKLREHEAKLLSEKSKLEDTIQSSKKFAEAEMAGRGYAEPMYSALVAASKAEAEEGYERLKRKEQKLIRFALVVQAAELLQREQDKGGFMQPMTAETLEELRKNYPEDSIKGRRFWDEARWWAGQLDRNISENALAKYEATAVQMRNEIKKLSAEINEIEQKLEAKGDKIDVEAVELNSQLRDKIEERKEKQKELIELCKDWTEFKNAYDAIYAPHGRFEKWAGPGSETQIRQFIEEYAEKDIRNRLGIFGRTPERLTGFVSSVYERGTKFLTEHGGTAILATTILAPFTMPFVGAGLALGLTGGAYAAYSGKAIIRKFGDWEMKGYPYWAAQDKTLRVMSDLIQWGPVFTARGSGAYLMTMRQIWESQAAGSAYLTKGLRLDEYGNVKPDYEIYRLPSVGLPFYIAGLKGIYENIGTHYAYYAKKAAVATMLPGGWDQFRLVLAENPRVPPEIKKSIQYQMVQLYGSILPLPYSKQARAMLQFGELSRSIAFYEPAKDVIPIRQFSFNPAGLQYGLAPESSRYARGYLGIQKAMEKQIERQQIDRHYNALERARGRFGS